MRLSRAAAASLRAALSPLRSSSSSSSSLGPLSALLLQHTQQAQHYHHHAFTAPWMWHPRDGWQRARDQALPRSRLMAAQPTLDDDHDDEHDDTASASAAANTDAATADAADADADAADRSGSDADAGFGLTAGIEAEGAEDEHRVYAPSGARSSPPAPPLRPPFSVVSAAARENSAEPTADPMAGHAQVQAAAPPPGTAPDVHNNPDVAQTVFESAWRRVEREIGAGNMRFPKEIIFLNGAPGSGKGTMAEYFVRERHITHVATSDLLDTPEARAIKASGRLVNDSEVFHLVLKTLLQPQHHFGLVLDGFPRTRVQVECVRQLHQKMLELHKTYRHKDLSQHFPRPKFHMVMLYIEEEESIRRQMSRGEKVVRHNKVVESSGEGSLMSPRDTDNDRALASERYRIFREEGYEPLKTLRSHFNYHFIAADGRIDEVRERVLKEFAYQSSLELDDNTFAKMDTLPLAGDIQHHFRQNLVRELDQYQSRSPQLLDEVLDIIRRDFLPLISLNVSSGLAYIKTDHDIFFERPKAVRMAVACLAERGFNVTVTQEEKHIPREVDLKTGRIQCFQKPYYQFEVTYPRGKRGAA